MMGKPSIIIIAGPSAVGKTTVASKIVSLDPKFEFVRSVTTRPRRGDSFDDEYIYLTREEFEALLPVGGVLEHTEYAGAFYGTPRSEIDRISGEGRIPILVLDINGVESLMRHKDIATCAVYVYDDLNVMEKRLYDRFLGANPTVDGLTRFASRKDKNISDYLTICDHAPAFYAFYKNGETVDDAALGVIRIFDEFLEGKPREDENVMAVAEALRSSAEQKLNPKQ